MTGKFRVKTMVNPSDETIEEHLNDGWWIAYEQWVVMDHATPGRMIRQKPTYCCRMVTSGCQTLAADGDTLPPEDKTEELPAVKDGECVRTGFVENPG